MPSATLPFYTVNYLAPPPLVRGQVLRPLSAAEFTEACELLLAQAREHGCAYWLLDGRRDNNARPPAVYEWLVEEYMPRVRRVLGRVPCLAFVAQPRFWQELQALSYAPPPPALISAAFRAGWFTDEAAALAWLDSFRTNPNFPS